MRAQRPATLALCLALTLVAADRARWRRADGGPTDRAAAEAALSACQGEASGSGAAGRAGVERTIALCMSRRGYFSWDGV